MKFDVSILISAASMRWQIVYDSEFVGVSPMTSHSINLLWNRIEGRFSLLLARIPEVRDRVERNSSAVDRTAVRFDFCRALMSFVLWPGSWQKASRLPLKSCSCAYLHRRDSIEASVIKAANSLITLRITNLRMRMFMRGAVHAMDCVASVRCLAETA